MYVPEGKDPFEYLTANATNDEFGLTYEQFKVAPLNKIADLLYFDPDWIVPPLQYIYNTAHLTNYFYRLYKETSYRRVLRDLKVLLDILVLIPSDLALVNRVIAKILADVRTKGSIIDYLEAVAGILGVRVVYHDIIREAAKASSYKDFSRLYPYISDDPDREALGLLLEHAYKVGGEDQLWTIFRYLSMSRLYCDDLLNYYGNEFDLSRNRELLNQDESRGENVELYFDVLYELIFYCERKLGLDRLLTKLRNNPLQRFVTAVYESGV